MRHGLPVRAVQAREAQRAALCHGDQNVVVADLQHLPGLGRRVALRGFRPAHQQDATTGLQARAQHRVPIGTMVQRTDQPRLAVGILRRVQRRRMRRAVDPHVAFHRRVGLSRALIVAPFQHVDQLGQTAQRCFPAAGVQGQGGVVGCDLDRHAQQDRTFVHAAADAVPSDRVALRPLQQRPDRGVQPGPFGQRTVVEIDRPPPRQGQRLRRNDGQVRHAEDIIAFRHRTHRQALRPRRRSQSRVLDRERTQDMAAPGQDPRRFQRKRGVADQCEIKLGHGLSPGRKICRGRLGASAWRISARACPLGMVRSLLPIARRRRTVRPARWASTAATA